MLRHRRVIDVPEGLLKVGLHCRPGLSGAPSSIILTTTGPLAQQLYSRSSNRAAHENPFLEVDCEHHQPFSPSKPLWTSLLSMKWPVSLVHTWWGLAADRYL